MRQILNEQLRCLDSRLDMHLAMVLELQDFYKRRAEVEMEYSRNLDKLVRIAMARHKDEKHRRRSWPGFSTYTCWQTLLASTKRASKDHSIMSEVYNGQMLNRFTELMDDMQRIYKECRETGFMCHEELIKVLNELQNAMKTYHIYHNECQQSETKLKAAESRRTGLEQHASKGTLSRKHKAVEKNAEKRLAKYSEAKKKALKSRNDYVLCIEGANAAINKYFVDDIHDLVDCMDCGYHNAIARAMMTHISSEENMIKSRKACLDLMNKCVSELDQRADKQWFLECYNLAFAHPKKYEFQAHKGDEVSELSTQSGIQEELLGRSLQITQRLTTLRTENDEVWKTLETAEKSLMIMINQKDYDVGELFTEDQRPPKSPHEHAKKRSDRLETEAFYLKKFRSYLLQNNLITRLQAKHSCIHKSLGEGTMNAASRPPSLPPKPKKRRIGRTPFVGQPKLFGGSIEEYTEATNEEIPRIVKSCVRIINLYGMHHQGLFRVSGSKHEISDFKQSFERDEDPLDEMTDGRDINSVAGVLKLYLRELREPLFPTLMFDEFIACCRIQKNEDMIVRLKELLNSISRNVYVVMRYLFAFLSHVTEYKDENMMDPYNLAICFGPTLIPIPPGSNDLVVFSNHANELVMNMIVNQDRIFCIDENENPESLYEKCILEDSERVDEADGVTDAASDEEAEVSEAVALYDFTGRTTRELTFNKGDTLMVFTRVSNEWWEGACQGLEGLIPDKYISLRNRDEDRVSVSEDDTRRSTESLPAKPFGTTSLSIDETLDKSASHPNISMIASEDEQAPSTSKSSTDLTQPSSTQPSIQPTSQAGEASSSQEGASSDTAVPSESPVSSVLDQSTDELQQDIECALAEVMHGLHSLQMQQQQNQSGVTTVPGRQSIVSPRLQTKTLPSHTPDLVLDLPLTVDQSATAQPKPVPPPTVPVVLADEDSPTLTTAEVFAKSNQSTMKKGSSMPRGVTSAMAANFAKLAVTASIKRSHSTAGTSSTRGAGDMRAVGLDNKAGGSGDLKTDKSDSGSSSPMMRLSGGKERPSVPMLTPRKKHLQATDSAESIGESASPRGTPPRSSTPKPDMPTKDSFGKEYTKDMSRVSVGSDSDAEQSNVPQRPARSNRAAADKPDRPTERPKPPLRAKPAIMRKPQTTPSPEPAKRQSSPSVLDSKK